jgi:glycosidase
MKIMDEAEIPGQKEIFQVGESFGSRAFIRSFTGPGLLSSQFDFPLYFDAREIFGSRKSSFKNLLESLELSLSAFGSSSLMVNLIGNHDTARFISYASGELVFSDNVNSAEWNKKIMVFDEEAFKRHRLFLTFLITIPGIPMIYYGDEFGMAGAGDPDNRRQMRFPGNLFKNERITLEYTSKLVWLRRNHPCLRYGDFIPVQADEETFVYLRNYFDEVILIAMNRSQEEKNLEIKLPLLPCSSEISMDLLTGEQVKATKNHSKLSPMKLMLNVPANGVRLLSIAHD